MKVLLTLSLFLWVSGCASQASHEVRCDVRLQPINLPMPKSSAAAAPALPVAPMSPRSLP